MSPLHAAATDELPTVEGTPTECADIVPDQDTTEATDDVTCPACLAVVSAKRAGNRARHAIAIGEESGLFRNVRVRSQLGSGSNGR